MATASSYTVPRIAPGWYHVRRRYSGDGELLQDGTSREMGYLAVALGDIVKVTSHVGIGHAGNQHDWYVWCRKPDCAEPGWVPVTSIGSQVVVRPAPMIMDMTVGDEYDAHF